MLFHDDVIHATRGEGVVQVDQILSETFNQRHGNETMTAFLCSKKLRMFKLCQALM
jgi:hypothetical protein